MPKFAYLLRYKFQFSNWYVKICYDLSLLECNSAVKNSTYVWTYIHFDKSCCFQFLEHNSIFLLHYPSLFKPCFILALLAFCCSFILLYLRLALVFLYCAAEQNRLDQVYFYYDFFIFSSIYVNFCWLSFFILHLWMKSIIKTIKDKKRKEKQTNKIFYTCWKGFFFKGSRWKCKFTALFLFYVFSIFSSLS